MTPRQVAGKRNTASNEFARQLAERQGKGGPPQKKFKSSDPKGVKLAAGFTDRTKDRREKEKEEKEDEEDSELARRIRALEKLVKDGQMDRETFDRTVQEITGGDIMNTHLVKGLDRKLLERVRQGERVADSLLKREGEEKDDESESEAEEELDELLANQEIKTKQREKVEKKGEKAPVMPPPPVAGVKRTRNEILAELKAQRQAAAEAAAAEHAKRYPSLGTGFRKVGPGGETSRLEIDSSGREVLIITNPDGTEKRKVRKQKVEQPQLEARNDIEDLKNPVKIPELPPQKEEESEDEDIFEGVGSNYNPLANIEGEEEEDDDDDESSEDDDAAVKPSETPKAGSTEEVAAPKLSETPQADSTDEGEEPEPEPQPQPKPTTTTSSPLSRKEADSTAPAPAPQPRRNYFNDKPKSKSKDAADATVLAALKKVRTLDVNSSLLQDTEEARLAKRAAELAAGDRDMEDMDMGFGGSRFDDADEMDMEGEKVKFSEWKGLGAEEDDEEGDRKGKGAKRKRGPKKKRGDKNNAADVLKVMERQKGAKTLG